MKHWISAAARLLLKGSFFFAFGGGLYYMIEVVFRLIIQHEPPMPHAFFLGGGALLIGLALCRLPLTLKRKLIFLPILGFFVLTAYEYFFGLYFLETQGLRIWDYTGCNFEYRGLICLKFSLCWGALMWLILGMDLLSERLLRNTPFSNKSIFGGRKNKTKCL